MSDQYRKNVGIVIINQDYRVLLARRNDPSRAWQFPQGGVDEHESMEDALYREVKEELDLVSDDFQLLVQSKHWYYYKFPTPITRDHHSYIGQQQQWFLLKLNRQSCPINIIKAQTPEFDAYQWVTYWYPIYQIVAFKRPVYQAVLMEFSQFLNA